MLPAVLPGIRQIRGPLAAGLLWFFGFWVAFGDDLRKVPESTDPALQRIVDLWEALGPLSAGVVVGAAAYLVGAIFLRAQQLVLGALKQRFANKTGLFGSFLGRVPGEGLKKQAQEAIDTASASGSVTIGRAVERLEATTNVSGTPAPFDRDVTVVRIQLMGAPERRVVVPLPPKPESLLDEQEAIRRRLLDRREQLAEHLGRLEAELELRAALVLPILFLAIVLAIEVDLWWLLLALLPVVLALEASAASHQLERETVDAILTSAAPEEESSEIASYESAVRDFVERLELSLPAGGAKAIIFER